MSKPKIAYLLQSFYIGGIETCIYNISKNLKDKFDFYFIATENPDIHPHFNEVGKAYYFGNNWEVINNLLISKKIDIVQYGNKLEYKKLALNAHVPIIIERTAGPRSCGLDKSGVSWVISSSKGTVPLIRKNYSGPLSVIYNGADLDKYLEVPPNRCGFKDNDFVVVYSARYGRGQAFDVLVNAVKIVRSKYDIKLILIGGPPNIKGAEDITSLIKKWVKPLGSNCKLTGFMLDPTRVMAAADVYCCPARHHGVSNTLIESSALSKPLIATNVGQTNEILHNNRNGYLVPVNRSDVMAQKIIELYENAEKRKQFGEYGRKLVEKEFNINVQSKKYEELYTKLLENK